MPGSCELDERNMARDPAAKSQPIADRHVGGTCVAPQKGGG